MKNVINSLTYNFKEHTNGEVNTQPSMTQPDQAMSIREILERFSRGLPIEGQKVPIYDEENDLPDIKTLDLAERQELKENYQAELAAMRERRQALVPEKPPVPYEAGAVPGLPGRGQGQGSSAADDQANPPTR